MPIGCPPALAGRAPNTLFIARSAEQKVMGELRSPTSARNRADVCSDAGACCFRRGSRELRRCSGSLGRYWRRVLAGGASKGCRQHAAGLPGTAFSSAGGNQLPGRRANRRRCCPGSGSNQRRHQGSAGYRQRCHCDREPIHRPCVSGCRCGLKGRALWRGSLAAPAADAHQVTPGCRLAEPDVTALPGRSVEDGALAQRGEVG